MLAISKLFRRCNHALIYLFGQGSWGFKAHEISVLREVLDQLDSDVRSKVEKQLAQSLFIERMPDGKINIVRFYRPDEALRIPNREFADLLMKVRLQASGQQQTAHVTFYNGYLSTIEFKMPGRYYRGKEIVIIDAVVGRASESYTHEIDAIEHGDP